jgi:hypothetical protein
MEFSNLMTIVALTNTANAIIWGLPPGKPNPQEQFKGSSSPDTRSRVIQAEQKGSTCSYYAFLPLRMRIGPIHSPFEKENRQIEKTISLWRKQFTAA